MINGAPMLMEIDTGAAVFIVSQLQLPTVLQEETSVKPTNIWLKTYTGQPTNVIGEIIVDVCHNQQSEKLPLVVVAEESPSLM